MLNAFDFIIQLKMYPLIQDVAKFRSQWEKYKMDFYPELR